MPLPPSNYFIQMDKKDISHTNKSKYKLIFIFIVLIYTTLYRFLIKKILIYRNKIQLYYFIENIIKGRNHRGLIKNTPISISNNEVLINSNVQEYDEQEYLELNPKNGQETHYKECGSTIEGK